MEPDNENRTRTLSSIAARVAVVAAILGTILSVLMIANYLQTQRADPLNSKAIQQLMLQLQDKPDDVALKEQIRALDLLARRAYFTSQWQIRTGSTMLFLSILVFLICLKYLRSLEPQLPDLTRKATGTTSWQENLLAKRYLTYTGISLFAVALLIGILSENELRSFGTESSDIKVAKGNYPTADELRENWPGFRGAEGIGIAHQTDVPVSWNGTTGDNIRWKTEIPLPGFSSPVIWKDRLFLSGADKKNQAVYCIDTDTGDILWQAELNDIQGSPPDPPKVADDTGFAASTLATDGKFVHVIFATGDVATLDFDGNRIWAKNIGEPDNHYGHSSSLITYQELLLIQFDHHESQHLLGLRAASGEQVYHTLRGSGISWASPILVNTGQRDEIILSANPQVVSYDPRTGQELWRVECMDGEVAPSPAYADRRVFVANEYARLAAIELSNPPTMVWETTSDLPEVSSPVATNDFVFIASSAGAVSCLDAKTGERYWVQDFDRGFYSSTVLVDELVYAMDMKGVTHVFKAATSFELVSKSELGENAVTTPAIMPARIYIRGEKNLYCISSD
jgi:outer membrane protein assembly factor BamB